MLMLPGSGLPSRLTNNPDMKLIVARGQIRLANVPVITALISSRGTGFGKPPTFPSNHPFVRMFPKLRIS